jgi:hypothetical protein
MREAITMREAIKRYTLRPRGTWRHRMYSFTSSILASLMAACRSIAFTSDAMDESM